MEIDFNRFLIPKAGIRELYNLDDQLINISISSNRSIKGKLISENQEKIKILDPAKKEITFYKKEINSFNLLRPPVLKPEKTPVPFYINAAWRSMLIPGWGQCYKKQPVKGYIFAGTELLLWAGTLGSYLHYNNLVDDYKKSPSPEKYDTLGSWYDINHVLFILSLIGHAYNITDALIFRPGPSWFNTRTGIESEKKISLSLYHKIY